VKKTLLLEGRREVSKKEKRANKWGNRSWGGDISWHDDIELGVVPTARILSPKREEPERPRGTREVRGGKFVDSSMTESRTALKKKPFCAK